VDALKRSACWGGNTDWAKRGVARIGRAKDTTAASALENRDMGITPFFEEMRVCSLGEREHVK
jgi:hypothetical protein